MDENHKLQIIKRLYEEVFTYGNLNVCDEIFATNLRLFDSAQPETTGGLSKYKETEKMYLKAFPDRKTTIDDLISSDNKVAVRWHCQATHSGDLGEIAATNKRIHITGISIYKFNDKGRIEEAWQSWDRLGLLEQMGQIDPVFALY